AVLAGSADFIDRAWRWKQRIGGAMRQAGVCAAACSYALEHNVERLADDHANAKQLANALAKMSGVTVIDPETNLVFFDPRGAGTTSHQLTAELRHQGVHLSTMGPYVRACAHLDVDRTMIDEAAELICGALERA
ncbi:MAG: beta-eliminating lyase-related protein, partial [Hyphomicrobiaceae bacterium]